LSTNCDQTVERDRVFGGVELCGSRDEMKTRYGAGITLRSALEIAEAFEVSSQVIAGILGTAERRLARLGLTPIQLRAAARREA
jgi:hypothetical protein